jgi:hypothetical protein
MNPAESAPFIPEFTDHLRSFARLCDDTLELVSHEGQSLAGSAEYEAFDFYQGRKSLLLRLDEGLNRLRAQRLTWQRLDPAERAKNSEVKFLLQSVQDNLVKILVLDRENQQALLRRGLVPARHMPSFTVAPPHYASQVYRRHAS